ncbi:MAG: TonB-dependent receptor, partial [Sphingorhabdus sp.]|nr:TonB-dependent receptor [Sphingorhabdus sp.]
MPCPSPVDRAASDDQDQPVIVVTGTGAVQQSDESGLAIALFDSDAIARLQPATIAELLVRTPGVTISNTGPIGGFSAVRIRGAEGEQTLALVDGVRINDPASPGGGFDFGNLLIGNIEQVEVLRGPNSVPWGSQAIGGVVNIVTRRPTENIAANLRAEYGGNDRGTLAGNLSGRSGPIRY